MLALLLVISIALEALLFMTPFLWKIRRFFVAIPLVVTAFSAAGIYLTDTSSVTTALIALSGAFRIINHLRVAEGRMHQQYLLRAARRTGFVLGLLQLALIVVDDQVLVGWTEAAHVIIPLQVGVATLLLAITLRNLAKLKHRPGPEHYSDKELPTVTVAIPARNETADMEDCLRSVLANTYPKLEVLVLDDSSQDKTPDIIRSFAHDGVRFIKGAEPQERWLAKNQAYDRLVDEASGELVLFCGVDVRFGPDTIRALVTTLLSRKKDMVSVMPRRLTSDVLAAFVQPMRYWWEVALPRRYFNRPPVLSTCWLIRRKKLKKLGGFDAVQHTIIPEGFFARELVKTDGYTFMRADDELDVQTRKSLAEQRQTAIRTRYPQVRRRPEWVMLLVLAEVTFLLGPFVALLFGLWLGFGVLQVSAAVACALLVLTHVAIVQVTNPANVLVAAFNFPLVILTELTLGLSSMFKYEFSTVEWKGRAIQDPVMHVIPRLPDIDHE